jgi:anti-sigma factor (TIGR02949 family)
MSHDRSIECEEVLRLLFAYIDGEVEGDKQQQIDAHMHLCRSCFSRAEFERRLKTHIRELGHVPVSAEFEQRIRALVDGLQD